jgi:ABC-type transport system substrate-binding protein
LADRWSWENEGRSLHVTLRKGVTLHDDTHLTASIVAEALKAAFGRPANQAQYSSFSNVTDVRPVGELDLMIDLSQPSAFLPEDLEIALPLGQKGVGTGAFRVVSTEPTKIVLERFDKYHLGRPQIERVVINSFRTLRTAWTSLLRSEVDMVTNVPPDAVEFVSNDDVQVISFARRFQFMVAFNSNKAPLNRPSVRRALNVAIDRPALIKNVLQTRGVASTGPIWPEHWAYDKSVAGYAFDPEQAGALLDAAGLPIKTEGGPRRDRFQFTCLIPANFALVERVALEVQKQLYNAGVDMQFEVIPIGEFDSRIREGRFEAMLIDMISGPTVGRVHNFWRSTKHFKGFNVFGYENSEAERLFNLIAQSTNDVAVRSATSRLQRVLLDDPPALFLAWTQSSRAVRRQFRVVEEPGRDPLYTIWRWTAAGQSNASATD